MLEAAVRIVAERGLDALTLAECGEAAGYSRGLAPHYFGSKDALVEAIARHIVNDYSERLRAGQEQTADRRSGLDAVLASVAFYLDSARRNKAAVRAFHAVLGSALTQPSLAGAVARLNRDSVARFARAIERGIARGEIRSEVDPKAQAALIVAGLRGAVTQWLIDPRRVPLDAIREQMVASLRRSLAP